MWDNHSNQMSRGGPALDFRCGAVRREIQAAIKIAERKGERAIINRLQAALARLQEAQGL